MKRWVLGLLVIVGMLSSQTRVDLGRQGKKPDFTQMAETKPVQAGPELPAFCLSGQLFFKTGAEGAQTLHACVSENRWEAVSGLRGCSVDENNNLSCPGDVLTGDSSRPGEVALYETGVNGQDFISWLAPPSIPLSYRLQLPSSPPASGQVLAFSAPSGGIVEGSWTTPAGAAPPGADSSLIFLVDEFMPTTALAGGGAYGQLGWQPLGSGVNYKESSSTNPWPGLIELTSNGVVNQVTAIHLAGYGFSYPWFWSASQNTGWEFEFTFKTDPYFGSQHITRIGLANSAGQNPTDGIWVEAVNNSGCSLTGTDANWMYVTRSGGNGPARIDSGVVYSTNTQIRIRMRSVTLGQVLISMSVNGSAFTQEELLSVSTSAALSPIYAIWGCDGQNHRLIADRFQVQLRR